MAKKSKASDPEELKKKKAQKTVLKKITDIQKMTWQNIFNTSSKGKDKRGLNWEVLDQKTDNGDTVASIRLSDKMRARVCRDGQWMRFISLHPDHDSAYKK